MVPHKKPEASSAVAQPAHTSVPRGSSPQLSRADGLGAKILILFSSILLSLLALEGMFRLMESRIDAPIWSDRPTEWYLPEGTQDQRNMVFAKAKPEGTFRIVVIGDSFTFAGKVHFDDNFAKRLERMLELNSSHPNTEVLNWGIPGYSTQQEALLVRKAIQDYKADLVVLEITLNDPEVEPYHVSHANLYTWQKHLQRWPLFTHWHSLQYFAQRILNSIRTHNYLEYHQSLFEKANTWSSFSNALEKIRRTGRDASIPVVAMVFPMLSHPFDEHYPFREAHAKIDAKLAELEMPVLDLLSAFQGIPPERLQAKPGEDAHPNEIAHRIAADSLYAFLKNHNLLPTALLFKESRQKGRRLPKGIVMGRDVGAAEPAVD
jgi:lysophospholipase L1-like esterase